MKITNTLCMLTTLLGFSGLASAADLSYLQKEWALANYQLTGDAQDMRFEQLIVAADKSVESHPNDAELLIWQGIIKSSYAGISGGLSALGLVKDAKKSLEAAIKIDPDTLKGSAYTSLGALYYQVPGWPIGFGNDKKAREYLQKALIINPEGIDPNYFYGEFLVENKEYDAARVVLKKAQAAPARLDRKIADEGRRSEVALLLSQLAEG